MVILKTLVTVKIKYESNKQLVSNGKGSPSPFQERRMHNRLRP